MFVLFSLFFKWSEIHNGPRFALFEDSCTGICGNFYTKITEKCFEIVKLFSSFIKTFILGSYFSLDTSDIKIQE